MNSSSLRLIQHGMLFKVESAGSPLRDVARMSTWTWFMMQSLFAACTPPTATAGKAIILLASTSEVETNLDGYLQSCKLPCETMIPNCICSMWVVETVRFWAGPSAWFRSIGHRDLTRLASLVKDQFHAKYTSSSVGLKLPESSFDVVTMYDLIEHTENPKEDLEHVFRVLKSGGVFFALTPNDQALLRRISRVLFAASLQSFSSPMRRLYYPDHLSYFTAESLSQLLVSTGFELISLNHESGVVARATFRD